MFVPSEPVTAQLSLAILHEQRNAVLKKRRRRVAQPDRRCPGADNPVSAIDKLKVWYNNLVDASSLVFEFEYFTRRS